MLHYTRLLIRLLYIKEASYATVHTVPSVKHARDRTLNMRTRAYQGDSYTLNTYQTEFIHSWTVLHTGGKVEYSDLYTSEYCKEY